MSRAVRGLSGFFASAAASGCPPDQIAAFLSADYVAQPRQLAFHAAARACDAAGGPDQVAFGGARGPGKSHASFAQLALDDCRRFPGLKCLYLRKVGRQAREQFEDLRRTVLASVRHAYNRQAGIVELGQGSRIFIGHFKDEKDVDRYLGIEYDAILIEECTTLSLAKYQTLRDSNRSSKAGWRPRIYNTTNPGGVGHAWYKARFVDPWRAGTERYTRFIPSTVDDNAFIDADYRRKLEENTGWKLRAYRYGDWDIAAGQYFTTWRQAAHVIAPFPLPPAWPLWAGFDYGFTHPTAVALLTQDGDGHLYVVGEHAESRWLPVRHVQALAALVGRLGRELADLEVVAAGADVFARRDGGPTLAEQYADLGLPLTPAITDRINGAGRVLALLGDVDAGLPPQVRIFATCARLAEQLPSLQHDPRRPEDVRKTDIDEAGNGGDDLYDALRYGVMAAPGGGASDLVAAGDGIEGEW